MTQSDDRQLEDEQFPLVDGYERLWRLGSGGTGLVWKAKIQGTNKQRALKCLKEAERTHPDKSIREDSIRRFHRECGLLQKATRELGHPVVVTWMDTIQDSNKTTEVLVCEFIDGDPILNWLQSQSVQENRPLSWREIVWLLWPLAHALKALHKFGFGHRDISAKNVLVPRLYERHLTGVFSESFDSLQKALKLRPINQATTEIGMAAGANVQAEPGDTFVRLIDFGSAKPKQNKESDITEYTSTIGTANYRAPEFASIPRSDHPDAFAADVYSFGALLFHCLVGSDQEHRNGQKIESRIRRKRPSVSYAEPLKKHQPAIPHSLAELIGRCLETTPNRRPTASELVYELRRLTELPDERLAKHILRPVPLRRRLTALAKEDLDLVAVLSLLAFFVLTVVVFGILGFREKRNSSVIAAQRNALGKQNEALESALIEARNARTEAVRRNVRQLLDKATLAIDQNAGLMALPELLEVRRLDADNQNTHDGRISTVLHYAPKLMDCFVLPGVHSLEWIDSKGLLMAASHERIWLRTKQGQIFSDIPFEPYMAGQDALVKSTASSYGRYIASVSTLGDLYVTDIEEQTPMRQIRTDRGVTVCRLSSDGSRIAWGNHRGLVECRELLKLNDTGVTTQVPKGVTAISFSPDGKRLAIGYGDASGPGGGCKLCDVTTLEQLSENEMLHEDDVLCLSFCKAGDCLATGDWLGNVKIWNGENGTLKIEHEYDQLGRITDIKYSHQNHKFALCSTEGTARVWNLGTRHFSDLRHDAEVTAIAFCPAGQIATAGFDKCVRIWDTNTKLLKVNLLPMSSHVTNLAVPEDGHIIACSDGHGVVKSWFSTRPAPQHEIALADDLSNGRVFSQGEFLRIDRANDRVIVASGPTLSAGVHSVWSLNATTAKVIGSRTDISGFIERLIVSPSGKYVAIQLSDGRFQVWSNDLECKMLEESGTLVAFLDDDRLVAVGLSGTPIESSRILITHVNTTEVPRQQLGQHVLPNVLHCQGDIITCLTEQGSCQQWNTSTGELCDETPLSIPVADIRTMSSSPDNSLAVMGTNDGKLVVTGSRTAKLLASPHQERITSISFSSDNQRFATSSADRIAAIWDRNTLQVRHTLKHRDAVNRIVFSVCNQFVATSEGGAGQGNWGSARVWDVDWGQPITPELLHNNDVYDIAFHPIRPELWTTSWDGFVRCWIVPTSNKVDSMTTALCRVASGRTYDNGLPLELDPDETERAWIEASTHGNPVDYSSWNAKTLCIAANVLLESDRFNEYNQLVAECRKRLTTAIRPRDRHLLLWSCGMSSKGITETSPWEDLADRSQKLFDENPDDKGICELCGAIQYRAARYDKCIAIFQQLADRHGGQLGPYGSPFIVMSYAKIGEHESARRWASQLRSFTLMDNLPWQQRVEIIRLRRECDAVLEAISQH